MLKTAAGFSLLEILVAMAGGLMVLVTAFSLLVSLLVSGNTHLQLSRLNQEVQSITDLISRDVQRAGFHPSAMEELARNVPPSNAIAQHLVFSATDDLYPAPSASPFNTAHCLRVKFWEFDAPAGEQLIVRIYYFQESTGLLRVHTHHDVQSMATLSSLCVAGSGNQLTSGKEIRVKQLSFRLTPNSLPQSTRSLELELSAAYVKRPELTQTLRRRILLRNQGGGV